MPCMIGIQHAGHIYIFYLKSHEHVIFSDVQLEPYKYFELESRLS